MSSALRLYLRELRIQQHISQRELAEAIGMSLRAFSDWETGKSDELKGSSLVRAMVYLRGSWEDIVTLVMSDLRDEDAEKLASNQLQQATVSDQVNADEMQELINDLWKDAKLRMAFIAFWSGWKAKDTSTGA